MPASTWEHAVVQAPLRRAPELMPDEVADGSATLDLRHERMADTAFWGDGTRRFHAGWTEGRWTGTGYVELRPHSSRTSEVVLHLRAPDGVFARLVWDEPRLQRAARALLRSLRDEIDTAAAREAPATRRQRRTA